MFVLAAAISLHFIQMFMRMVAYVFLGGAVLYLRHKHRKRNSKRLDKRTQRMMKHTTQDENGKYPWEKY